MPINTTARALAPSSVPGRLCQGSSDDVRCSPSRSSKSRPVTGTDSSPGRCAAALSAELGNHLAGEELHVVEVGHVEHLEVDALHAGVYICGHLVDDLGR